MQLGPAQPLSPYDHLHGVTLLEHEPVFDREADRNIYGVRASLESFGESYDWRSLAPNASSEADLTPREVSGKDLVAMYDAITSMPGFSESMDSDITVDGMTGILDHKDNEFVDLGEAGQLSYIDSGQAKSVWRWHRDDKSMAVALEFDANFVSRKEGVNIPTDPRFLAVGSRKYERFFEYSDLRTYARIPAGPHMIKLQELGEPLSVMERTDQARMNGARAAARRNILRAAPTADMSISDGELQHDRHYLKKKGYSNFFAIDIPVKQVLHDILQADRLQPQTVAGAPVQRPPTVDRRHESSQRPRRSETPSLLSRVAFLAGRKPRAQGRHIR
jgi:hypothetical protein